MCSELSEIRAPQQSLSYPLQLAVLDEEGLVLKTANEQSVVFRRPLKRSLSYPLQLTGLDSKIASGQSVVFRKDLGS